MIVGDNIEDNDVDVDDVEEAVANKLEECAEHLLSCELEGKKCKKCKEKDGCLIFIRTVLAALCRIEAARMATPDKNIEQGMFI